MDHVTPGDGLRGGHVVPLRGEVPDPGIVQARLEPIIGQLDQAVVHADRHAARVGDGLAAPVPGVAVRPDVFAHHVRVHRIVPDVEHLAALLVQLAQVEPPVLGALGCRPLQLLEAFVQEQRLGPHQEGVLRLVGGGDLLGHHYGFVDVGTAGLAQRAFRVELVTRVLQPDLDAIEVTLEPEDARVTVSTAKGPGIHHAIGHLAEVEEVLVQLGLLHQDVQLAVGGVLVQGEKPRAGGALLRDLAQVLDAFGLLLLLGALLVLLA